MDRLTAMQTFVRVVESGSFTAVAREMHSTQSAVSKQVAALERQLGARLLSRSTRSLALTEEGERYFEQARRLVAEIAEAEASLRRGEQQLTGWLRVAASVGFGRLRVLPLVQQFMAQHPGVRIDLRLHDGFIDLVEHGIDLAVRIGELADSSLVARRVATSRRAVLASRRYLQSLPRALRTLRTPEDLQQLDCIVYTELATGNAWRFVAGPGAPVAAGTEVTLRAQGSFQTNSTEAVRAAVLAGMGIGYVPTWLLAEELATGEVRQLLPQWAAPALPLHLVSPAQRRQSAKVRAFSDHLAAAWAE